MYRIDVLEDRLKTTPMGRQIAAVFETHFEEVMLLINQRREVTVTWHRNHGPAFTGSIVRSGFEQGYTFTREIEGVTLTQMIRRMAAALQDAGTPALKKAIGEHYALITHWAQSHESIEQVFLEIERLHPTTDSVGT